MYKNKLFSSLNHQSLKKNSEKYNLDRLQQLMSNFLSDLKLLYALEKSILKA